MIRSSGKIIEVVNYGKQAINKIYHGSRVVWESIASCFTKGFWLNNKPWTNTKGWKNN